jgi:hypothetical protein
MRSYAYAHYFCVLFHAFGQLSAFPEFATFGFLPFFISLLSVALTFRLSVERPIAKST